MMLQTPVLLLVFNRPHLAMQVFEQIRLQQPAQLFIAADGPRHRKAGEHALCKRTREQLLAGINWPCQVHTLFRSSNMGCGKAVSAAIDWFFHQVEEGIILEDDCLPDPSFFSFCEAMLQRYRHHDTVMHINGSNFQAGVQRGNASYYCSRYSHVWGWASWRRAWRQYDYSLRIYRDAPRKGLNARLRYELRSINHKTTDTWDVQWFMTVWFNQGWAITPNTCLIRNIGYGKDATHTRRVHRWFHKIVYGAIPTITHPAKLVVDTAADRYSLQTLFPSNLLIISIKRIVKRNTLLYDLCKRITQIAMLCM